MWRSLPYRPFPSLRYICFLNGLFGAFVGLLYNEAFAFPMGFFGTSRWEGFEEEGLSGMTCEHLERCEMWGDMGRYGEGLSGMTCEHLERCEMWGDMGRYGEGLSGMTCEHLERCGRAARAHLYAWRVRESTSDHSPTGASSAGQSTRSASTRSGT